MQTPLSLGLKTLTTSSSVDLKDEVITVADRNLLSSAQWYGSFGNNLYYLKACSDGKPVQRATERMHPLPYHSGLQKHPGK